MTPDQAAARCGVAPREVTAAREHPAGHLADLRNGRVWLVTDTVARPYVPEVDDERPDEQPHERPDEQPGARQVATAPPRGRRGRAQS